MPVLQDCCEGQAVLLLGCVFSASAGLCLFTLGAKDRLIVVASSLVSCKQQTHSLSLHVYAISSSLLLKGGMLANLHTDMIFACCFISNLALD
jgi:hypothetical protein